MALSSLFRKPAHVPAAQARGVLRLMTCGSVDDGKSTLIGRLLYDLDAVPEDQLSALAKRRGDGARAITGDDLAFLTDGLLAEREQGITIDVAYRYLRTATRNIIIADTPGHEQYTRNMATAASVSRLAVLLVDAGKGILQQTHRHTAIFALLGIQHVVLAVNKMDVVGFDRARFAALEEEYRAFANNFPALDITAIPMAARDGDNVVQHSLRMPWYKGPTLAQFLDHVDISEVTAGAHFSMPVQIVLRAGQQRAYAGTVASGQIKPGDDVVVLPTGARARIKAMPTQSGDMTEARTGMAPALVLDREVDISRGDVLIHENAPLQVAEQAEVDIIWLSGEALSPSGQYLVTCGSRTVPAHIVKIKHRLNVDTLAEEPARTLAQNDIARAVIGFNQPLVACPYAESRVFGSFIVIDKVTKATVAAGLVREVVRKAGQLHWQHYEIDKAARARALGQKPRCIWLTGLSGAGKSTLASLLEKRLHAAGRHTYILDGDNVRHGLNADLGFSEADRAENIRRVAEVAKLMVDAGLVVIVAFISPFRAEREAARRLFAEGEFVEVFLDTPLAECERRDPKGLYGRARRGEITQFTGISSPYEAPQNAELRLESGARPPEELAAQLLDYLEEKK